MGAFTYPNPIEPLTPADAAEVQDNNDSLVGYINTEVIARDGRVRMMAPLQLVDAEPLSANDAARKSYVDALLPIGVMMMWGSGNAPAGRWRLCDGSSLQAAAFPVLFGVLGYSYGGSGGTFKLPDLRHRVPIGVDTADTRFSTVGKVGGSYEASLLEHDHTITHDHGQFNSGNQSANHTHKITHDHGSFATGGGGAHSHAGSYQNNAETTGASTRIIGYVGTGSHATITDTEAAHTHTVNPPSFTGDSGIQSASHTHPVNVPSYIGNSGKKGTAGIDQIPEFCVVTYIIRTD